MAVVKNFVFFFSICCNVDQLCKKITKTEEEKEVVVLVVIH
jgi:hypothetical protein